MLHSLRPKAHAKTLVLPLLGPIADGFDDWLAATGYTAGSRRNAIRMLPHVDNDLRKRRVRTVGLSYESGKKKSKVLGFIRDMTKGDVREPVANIVATERAKHEASQVAKFGVALKAFISRTTAGSGRNRRAKIT